MTASKFNWYWLLVVILLAIIVVGGVVVGLRYRPGQPLEISIPPGQEMSGTIYIEGAVSNPGFYPFSYDDSLETLLQAAGANKTSVNLSGLKLYIPEMGGKVEPQKIDINRADVWLLKALPGIGDTLAQRIVDYRLQNGLFLNIRQLLKVDGIGTTTYERIKDLITVAE
ncbi:MAG: ComEA family DNA-binding protein [Chloroflexi bacterium]|nr:ComEA family DNA-binding protein [Chloroflexota bacterium]MBI2979499.1 ComEA family DNA-binding protein [Chloroflexota bacterium]